MSQENVERLRVAIDALRTDTGQRDWEALAGAWVELWDPESNGMPRLIHCRT
jgi:hypothetical protein